MAFAQTDMTAAEFRSVTEELGISQLDAARMLGVNPRTVRNWVQGRDPVPAGVAAEVDGWEDRAEDLALRLAESKPSTLIAFRSDDELWAALPETRPLPARWHRHVLARVADITGARIRFADDET